MIKWIRSKIGIQLLITFSVVLVLSMVSMTYIATRMVEEFGKFSADSNEINVRDNAKSFMARITHEQAMRYESIFRKFDSASALIAKQATFYLDHTELYGAKTFKPNEKLVIYPHNGIFSNDNSKKTMVLYWGSPTMSQDISEQIKTLSHIDPLLEIVKEENPESVACYVVTEPGLTRYYPNIHGVEKLPPTTKFDIRNANWYWIAKPENNLERKTKWSNIYLDSVGQGLLITASTPLYSKSGEFLGASGVDVTLNTIVNDILANIPSCHKMEGLFSFLIDNQGGLIAFPPEYIDMFEIEMHQDKLNDASIVLQLSILDSSNSEIRRIGETMLEKNFQVSGFILNRQHYIISSHFMPSTGWRLGVVAPESVVLASVQELRNTVDLTVDKMTSKFALLTALFLIFAIIVIVVFSIKSFIKPLDKLSKGALRVKEGYLTTHVDIYTKNEIGSLAKIFNNMIDTLREARDLEKIYGEKLEQKVKDRTQKLQIKNEEQESTLQNLKQQILERQKAENSLRESEDRFKALHNASFGGIAIHDKGIILDCNKGLSKMTGYSVTELIGMDGLLLIAEKSRNSVMNNILSGYEKPYEETGLRKNGEEFPIRIEAQGIPYKSKNVRVVEFRDITEQKLAEAEQEKLKSQLIQAHKMESIGTLTGGIAHDFNNIMGIIVGNTELALEDVPESNRAYSNLEEIKTASRRAANILKQLLSFTRITDQKLQPIEIASVIKDAVKFLRSTIPSTIDIEQDICVTDETILADPTQISQIMMNLCINASHAMEQIGGKLTITVENVLLDDSSAKDYPDLKNGKYVKVVVSDTGPGIDPKIIDRIFDPYFTTKGIGKGSGMGLAIVHGIVKNHNGSIKVGSTLGKGTKFSILFPLAQGKAAVEAATIQEIPRGNETLLFVDDEISIVNMVQRMFERLGYKVQTATTPQDALDRFDLNPDHFDLVITDMTMPQMTGVELSEKLMDIRPDIPIIICTGHSALVDEEKAKELGLAAYIMKPINMRETAQIIRKVLDKK
jgi:PAS domain S-box-containing protein